MFEILAREYNLVKSDFRALCGKRVVRCSLHVGMTMIFRWAFRVFFIIYFEFSCFSLCGVEQWKFTYNLRKVVCGSLDGFWTECGASNKNRQNDKSFFRRGRISEMVRFYRILKKYALCATGSLRRRRRRRHCTMYACGGGAASSSSSSSSSRPIVYPTASINSIVDLGEPTTGGTCYATWAGCASADRSPSETESDRHREEDEF